MKYLFYILLGYLSGSVLYAYYLPLWLKGIDVTQDSPDGNPGVFNCVAKAGWGMGVAAAVCEIAKGMAPVMLAAGALGTEEWPFALVVAAPVAGHAWPIFRPGRGGKGIAVSFGVMLGLLPMWQPFAILAACYLFFTLVVRLQPHRFRSIVSYLSFAVGMLVRFRVTAVALGGVLTSGIVLVRHREALPAEERPRAQFALRRE